MPVAAIDRQADAAASELILEHGDLTILEAAGRAFCRAELPLPMSLRESPVRALVWIELDDAKSAELIVRTSQGQIATGSARLACDLPGFRGLIGAACRWQSDPATGLPRITSSDDQRLASLPVDPSHDDLVAIYRLLWGNPHPVAGSDAELRAAVIQHWHRIIDQPLFRKPVEPPPQLAGFDAPEIAIAPPLDTGGEAVLATIGCAEQPGPKGERAELMLWAEDPSEEFTDSFSEFCFLSRMSDSPVAPGKIVPELRGIPGTAEMKGWLLVSPWWFENQADAGIATPRGTVSVLCPIPLHEIEIAFAQGVGVDRLIELLRERDTRITDLKRGPVLEPISPA